MLPVVLLRFKRCYVRPGLFPLEYSHFFGHCGLEKSSFLTAFVKLTLSLLRPSTSPHLPPSATGCNHLLGTWISRRPAAHSTLLTTKTDSSQRPRYSFFSLVQKNTHFHPHVALRMLHSYILSSTEQWFWQNTPLGCEDAIKLFGWVSATCSPSTLTHSKLMTRSLNMSLFMASQLLHLYTSRRRKKNQCPSEVERRSESGLPTGQRCIVGYWRVPTASEAMLRQHVYTNIIDRSGTNRSSRQSGPILYYPLRWNLPSQSIQENKLEWKLILHQKAKLLLWLLKTATAFIRMTFFSRLPFFFMWLTLFSEVEHALSTSGGRWRHAATSKSV